MRALVLLALAAAARAQSCTNCDENGCAPGTSSCPSECAIKSTNDRSKWFSFNPIQLPELSCLTAWNNTTAIVMYF